MGDAVGVATRRSRRPTSTHGTAARRTRTRSSRRRRTNRMVAFPYTRLLCSQWNVDQAAALVFACDGRGARARRPHRPPRVPGRRCGVERDGADVHPGRGPAVAGVRARVAGRARPRGCRDRRHRPARDLQLLPIGGRAAAGRARHLDRRPVSVTGGMTFGGGPLNNFVLQSTVAMAERLRHGDAATRTGDRRQRVADEARPPRLVGVAVTGRLPRGRRHEPKRCTTRRLVRWRPTGRGPATDRRGDRDLWARAAAGGPGRSSSSTTGRGRWPRRPTRRTSS